MDAPSSTTDSMFDQALGWMAEFDIPENSFEYSRPEKVTKNPTDYLRDFMPLPKDSILFGAADRDGLPILLNINKPGTGAVLVIGGSFSGKTALLQAVASGLIYTHAPDALQFATLTLNPSEWALHTKSPYCAGIFTPQAGIASSALRAMNMWINYKQMDQVLLLFIDGLELARYLDVTAVS